MSEPTGKNWIWMPHAAHLIVGQWCRFHVATVVGGKVKYIVSTVGEDWPERGVREIHARIHDAAWLAENGALRGDNFDRAYMKRFGYETIGCDRLYETMVFRAEPQNEACCPFRMVSGDDLDFDGYNDAGAAMAGHLALCRKWAARRAIRQEGR